MAREMGEDDIVAVINAFAQAAQRADEAGFDVIELHGAHGYLLHQFLSPLSNLRADRWGGSLANRMRFVLEVTSAVRARWPSHKPLFFRCSSVDDGGWTIDESVLFSGWHRYESDTGDSREAAHGVSGAVCRARSP